MVKMDRRSIVAGAALGIPVLALGTPGLARADDTDVDDFLHDRMRDGAIPGLAVGVAQGGRTRWIKTLGHADLAARRRVTPRSMFHLASVTKLVTATAIMTLVEDGRLALDDPAERHLDFPLRHPAAPAVPITIRHLLAHVSGISDAHYYAVDFRTPGADSPLALGDFLRSYLVPGGAHYSADGSFTAAAPGTTWDYSNVGYGLLGYLGGRASGTDFRVFIHERLFAHLGMQDVSWTIAGVPPLRRVRPYETDAQPPAPLTPVGFPDWSAGMLRASIAGLMPFVAAAANRGAITSAQMLPASAMAAMLEMHTPPMLPDWLTGQGLGWMESNEGGRRRINHWGGDPGVFTAVYIDPATTRGVAILTNASATVASRRAIKAIAARFLDGDTAG